MNLFKVLTDPNHFFNERMKQDIALKVPIAIVLIVGLIGAANAVMVTRIIMEALPEDIAAFAGIGAVVAAFGALIAAFIMWLVYSGAFQAISSALNGKGEFKRVLEFVAYGFIPSIASAIISLYVTVQTFSTIDFSMDDPQLLQQTIMSDPSMQSVAIIGIIFTIWSANIWIFALIHSRNLSTRNAAITVGVPVGLYIIYTAYTLLGA
ncbi:MAG: YIP1 family protein [Euryarchaeota archaeon]|nr:YIP1 family protein [Euryarchaeota archaeon]